MDQITKPSITRLARRAGVKSLSDDCYDTVRQLIETNISNIVKLALIVNSEHNTKTLMTDDIYNGLYLSNYNIAQSNELNTTSCIK